MTSSQTSNTDLSLITLFYENQDSLVFQNSGSEFLLSSNNIPLLIVQTGIYHTLRGKILLTEF